MSIALDSPAARILVDTPMPDLEDVLREINQIRAARGYDTIDALPRGECRRARHCVIYNALRDTGCTSVGVLFARFDDGDVLLEKSLYVFRAAFDLGLYPELES